jgi:prophage regulatory protein
MEISMIPLEIRAPKGLGHALPANRRILRLPAVLNARGRSRSSHYLDIKQGLFTSPVSLGARAVGWPEHEVATLNAARIAGQNDQEIRALVADLEADRKAGHQATRPVPNNDMKKAG